MGYRAPCVLAVFVLAVGCGGVVEQGGSGGSSSGGSPNGGSPNGGTGGAPVSCNGFTDCCTQACTMVADNVQCPGAPAPDCSCTAPGSLPAACRNALTAAYRCLLQTGTKAVKCDQNGGVGVRCGFCESEMQTLAQACSNQLKCVY